MRTIIKAFGLFWLGVTLAIMLSSSAEAQTKKQNKTESIQTNTPTMMIVHEVIEDGEVLGSLVIDIYDLKLQLDGIHEARQTDMIKGFAPRNPKLKLIRDEELGSKAYRIAESIDEIRQEEDGVNVIGILYLTLLDNVKKQYN